MTSSPDPKQHLTLATFLVACLISLVLWAPIIVVLWTLISR